MKTASFIPYAFLLFAAITCAQRVLFLDLPTKNSISSFYAGSQIQFSICWQSLIKAPEIMADHEWKVTLKRPLGKSRLLDVEFNAFKNVKFTQAFKDSAKGKRLSAVAAISRRDKCYLVTSVLPDDLPSSESYTIQLTRVRTGWFDRTYNKSPAFAIQALPKSSASAASFPNAQPQPQQNQQAQAQPEIAQFQVPN